LPPQTSIKPASRKEKKPREAKAALASLSLAVLGHAYVGVYKKIEGMLNIPQIEVRLLHPGLPGR
jgi:hypothetical protein